MSQSTNGDTKPLLSKVVFHGNPELSPEGDLLQLNSSGVDNKSFHLDEIIPPTHIYRTIVLCFDGIGDQLRNPLDVSQNSKNSNIVQFFSMLKKDEKSQQMVYYQVRQLIWAVRDLY